MEAGFAEDAGELAIDEEGVEGDEDDDGAGGEDLKVGLVQDSAGGEVMDDALDPFLEDVEDEDEEAEEEGFEGGGLIDGAGFGAAAEVHHLADEDDLAEDEGVEESE